MDAVVDHRDDGKEKISRERPPSNNMIAQRKFIDLKRWHCVGRPQYKYSCGATSVVSCWNYLFSTLGYGRHTPITQEEALEVLGFEEDYGEIYFGILASNDKLLSWFEELNRNYNVKGSCRIAYKPRGENRTNNVGPQQALEQLKDGLKRTDIAFIYHCEGHYFCPIGFEDAPHCPKEAYASTLPDNDQESWIIIGDTAKDQPAIHCIRWEDISADLNYENPDFLDVRRLWLGPLKRATGADQLHVHGDNRHCIMMFTRDS